MKTIATIILITGLALNAFAGGGTQPPRYVEPLPFAELSCEEKFLDVKLLREKLEKIEGLIEINRSKIFVDFQHDNRSNLGRLYEERSNFITEKSRLSKELTTATSYLTPCLQ